MRWINRARAKGAKVIVVDPRFTRTASAADIFAQIRPGTDIAYLGAIINYICENKLYDDYYLKAFTNAYYKVNPEYKFEDGLVLILRRKNMTQPAGPTSSMPKINR